MPTEALAPGAVDVLVAEVTDRLLLVVRGARVFGHRRLRAAMETRIAAVEERMAPWSALSVFLDERMAAAEAPASRAAEDGEAARAVAAWMPTGEAAVAAGALTLQALLLALEMDGATWEWARDVQRRERMARAAIAAWAAVRRRRDREMAAAVGAPALHAAREATERASAALLDALADYRDALRLSRDEAAARLRRLERRRRTCAAVLP